MPRRARPIEGEGQRQPAGLGAELFLPHIVGPAAPRLADAPAHHQEIDDAPVVHVHVVPVVETRPEDDHGLAVGLLGIAGKGAGDRDDLLRRNAGDRFRPGRRVGNIVLVADGDMLALEAPVETVVCDKQVEHGRGQRLAVLERDLFHRQPAIEHVRMVGTFEHVVFAIAEIGETNLDHTIVVLVHDEGQAQLGIPPGGILFLQVPLARLIPTEADRASGHHGLPAFCVDANSFPFGVGRLAQVIGEVGCPEHPVGHVVAVLFNQPDQHGHVGVLTGVILEVPRLTVDMELAQDDVSHGHGEGRIGALLGMQPQIGELGRLRVIRADDHRLGAVVSRLGIEVGVGGSGLRDVGPP